MVTIVMPKTAQEFDLLSSQAAQNAAAARAQNAQIDSGYYPAQVEQLKSATAANQANVAQSQAATASEQARLVGLNQQNEVASMNLEDAKASAIAQRAAAARIQSGAPVQQSVGSVPQAGPANQGDAQVVQAPQAAPQQVAPVAQAAPAPAPMAMPTAAPQGQAGAVQLPVAPIGGTPAPVDKGRPALPEFKPASVATADPLTALAKNNELAPGVPNYVSDRNIAIYVEEAQKAGVRPQAIQTNVQVMLKAREDQAKRIMEYRKEAEMMRKEGLGADKINAEITKMRKEDMNDDAYGILRRVASKNPGVQQAAVAEAQIKLGIDITSPEGKARIATMAEDSELFKKDAEQARKDRDTTSMIGRRDAETEQGKRQTAISQRNSDISAGHLSLARQKYNDDKAKEVSGAQSPGEVTGVSRDRNGNIVLAKDVQANLSKSRNNAEMAANAMPILNAMEQVIRTGNTPESKIGAGIAGAGAYLPNAMKPDITKANQQLEQASSALVGLLNDPRMKGNPTHFEAIRVQQVIADPNISNKDKLDRLQQLKARWEADIAEHNGAVSKFDAATKQRLDANGLGALDASSRAPAQNANGRTVTGAAPKAAIDALRADPKLAPQFKEKYGYLPGGQ